MNMSDKQDSLLTQAEDFLKNYMDGVPGLPMPECDPEYFLVRALLTALQQKNEEIEESWKAIYRSFEMERRELIERESKTNGFKFALVQAVHTIWKRDPKVTEIQAVLDLESRRLASSEECRNNLATALARVQQERDALQEQYEFQKARAEKWVAIVERDGPKLEAAEASLAALGQEVEQLKTYTQHKDDCELLTAYMEDAENARFYQPHVCGLQGFGALGDTCAGCSTPPTIRKPQCTCGLTALRARGSGGGI